MKPSEEKLIKTQKLNTKTYYKKSNSQNGIKRILTVFLVLFIVVSNVFLMCGCTYTESENTSVNQKIISENDSDNNDSDTIQILCTGFSLYDWTQNIVSGADNVSVSLLFKNGVDVHSFQPTADDIVKISHSTLLIYGGGESDSSIEDILNTSTPYTDSFNCLESIEELALTEDHSVAVQQDRFHQHIHTETELESEHKHSEFHSENDTENNTKREDSHEHEQEHDEHTHFDEQEHIHQHNHGTESESTAYDEHFWLSLKRAEAVCRNISQKLISIDPKNAEVYAKNTEDYCAKLSNLDKEYASAVSEASTNKLIFADRFPFLYLAKDYNLECRAAFSGCSAETSASFKTVIALADKLCELNLNYILVTDQNSTKTAETVIRTSGRDDVNVLALNSLQTVTKNDLDNNITYLSVMKKNLDILKTALNTSA